MRHNDGNLPPDNYPPRPSDGSRRPSPKSNRSFRAFIIDHQRNREFVTESMLEANVLFCLMADRSIDVLREQWPVIDDGEGGRHVFDFWAQRFDGRRTAYAVRPEALINQSGLQRKIDCINCYGVGGLADEAVILTDRDITVSDIYNAKRLLRSRRLRNDADVAEALELVSIIHGAVTFHSLLLGADVEARRRIALWSLIDLGVLRAVHGGAVLDRCLVVVNHDCLAIVRAAA